MGPPRIWLLAKELQPMPTLARRLVAGSYSRRPDLVAPPGKRSISEHALRVAGKDLSLVLSSRDVQKRYVHRRKRASARGARLRRTRSRSTNEAVGRAFLVFRASR